MKLPFDFATKFILRLILPGAVLAMLLWPIISALADHVGIVKGDAVRVPVAVLALGWVVMLLDMPIYMAFEGRRFWPRRAREWGCRREAARLATLRANEEAAGLSADAVSGVEYALRVRQFPLDRAGIEQAEYPTRLGNLLRACETYPDRKYGLDGVFTWYRVWLIADKDLRTELDDQQAMADGALYVAGLLLLGGPLCLCYAATVAIAPSSLPLLPGTWLLTGAATASVLAGFAVYRASLFAQAQYGEFFAAMFDCYAHQLPFGAVVDELAKSMNDPAMLTADPRERNRAAVRFLKWHRYRRVGETANTVVTNY